MKKYLHSTKIILLLCSLTLIGWSSTFVAQKDQAPVLTPSVQDLLKSELSQQKHTAPDDAAPEIIDEQSLQELDIDKVATTLDCTITHLGSMAFKHALKHPKTDRAYLANLQTAIRNLANHDNSHPADQPSVADRLTQFLTAIKEIEPMLTVLLFSKDSIYDATTHQVTLMPPLTYINKVLELLFSKESLSVPIDQVRTITSPWKLNLAFAGLAAADFTLGAGLFSWWAYHNLKTALEKGNLLSPATYLAPLWIAGKDFLQRHKTTGLVKDHLKALFIYIEQLRSVNTLLKKNSYFFDVFPELKCIITFVEKPEELSADVKKISSHEGTLSWLPSSTWCTYNTVKAEQKNMLRIFKTIGMLDFVLSLAKLYKKFQSNRVHFCFATHEQPDTPCMQMQQAWYPLYDPQTVVSNDLVIGSAGIPSKIILTGPNKGKSTTLKLVGLAAVLAQTITLVPADAARLPIFDYIGVNTTTAIPEKVSESQAEIGRMTTMLDALATCAPNHVSLTVFDRLLRMEDLAKEYNLSLARGLAKYSNNISIIATNNPELKKLEQENSEAFVNFKMTNKFKLERGTSSENHDAPWPDDFLPRCMLTAKAA